jgi:DNA-binding winged helix-turn-helix (wHTH) protein/tetratricopeptide (TPR) repeat protein
VPESVAYEFGPFRVEPSARRLLRSGVFIPLTAKAFDVLLVLVERAGQVVEKGTLMARLWPDAIVEEGNLAQQVHTVRRVLGDDDQSYIATVARRGYQFVGEVSRRSVERADAPLPPAPDTVSLAVLPFRPLGGGPEDEYLGLGLADALITRLSNVRKVAVIPTSAVRGHPKGADPDAAARALGVDWVLEGSFRRDRERLRVTVQLLSLPRGVPVWGETFNDRVTDPFSAQDAIARQVAEALVPSLSAEESARLRRAPTADPRAFEAYLKGRFQCGKRTEEGLEQAVAFFDEALARDPTYALAYAALAECLTLLGSAGYGGARPQHGVERARSAALRATELEPSLPEAHAALAFVRFRVDWDWRGAEASFQRAIALHPGCATAHHFYGLLLAALGRFDEAMRTIRRALELDPLSPNVATAVGRVLHFAGRYEEAIAQCREVVERDPGFAGAHADVGLALLQIGRVEEALGEIRRAHELSGRRTVITAVLGHVLAVAGRTEEAMRQLAVVAAASPESHLPAYVLIGLGRHDEALDLLEAACTAKAGLLVYLKVEPLFDRLRGLPRFGRLLEQAGLA